MLKSATKPISQQLLEGQFQGDQKCDKKNKLILK